jgi:hypothetical protein
LDNNTLLFTYTNAGSPYDTNHIWKGQRATLDLSSFKSSLGESLPSNSKMKFDFATVGPAVSWVYDNTYVYNGHTNVWYESDSWLAWAAQHGAIEDKSKTNGYSGGVYNGGVTCWTRDIENNDAASAPAINEKDYSPVTGDLNQGCGGLASGGFQMAIDPYYVKNSATFSAGIVNAIVNNRYDYTAVSWASYSDATLFLQHYQHYNEIYQTFHSADFSFSESGCTVSTTGCLAFPNSFDGKTDRLPSKIGDYIYDRLANHACSYALDNQYCWVKWWSNYSANYRPASRVDFWGAGKSYRDTYWSQANWQSRFTMHVDVW